MDVIKIPEMPQEIIDAINNDSLAVFVGAGVSAIAGLPLWSQLAEELICECYKKGLYSYKDKELILGRIHDNKQLITIAYGKLKEGGFEKDFYDVLNRHLTLDIPLCEAGRRIFSWLKDTMPLVLTTNADTLLHEYFEPSRIYEHIPDSADELPLQYGCLVHLHGVKNDKSTLVFTTQQYLKRYQEDQFRKYLKAVFTTKTVLFIGYGMSEFELLDILIQKSNSKIQHFFLAPYFTYEQPIATAMKEYYNQLGIEQIAYFIDEKGHSYLADILDGWIPNIKLKSDLLSRSLFRIRALAKLDPAIAAIKEAALQLIKSDKIIEKEFFDNLTTQTQYDIDWLVALESSECFKPELRNNPPKQSDGGDGHTYYSAVPWFGFRRLLEIAQATPENQVVRGMLLRVVQTTILDTLSNPEKAGNWAIGDAVAKSIVLLSPDDIGDEVWRYISLVSCSPFTLNQDIFTAEFSINIERILSWSSRQILRVLEMYFECQNKPGSESEYWLGRITEKWLSRIVILIPDSIVELCIRIIKQKYAEDDFRFWEVGAFAKFPDKNGVEQKNYRDSNAALIVWLRAAIEVLSTNSATELIAKYLSSQCPILRRMAIFTISRFFTDCGHVLFEIQNKNPFDDQEILSDLFDLIKVNLQQMRDDQIHKLYLWMLNSNFGIVEGGNSLAQTFRCALFLSLLKDLKREYLEEYNRFSSLVSSEILEHDAYNLSKHMYVVASDFEYPDPQKIASLKMKSSSEWPVFLANIAKDATQSLIWEWAEAIATILKNTPDLFLEDIASFLQIPDIFTPYIIRAIETFNYKDIAISEKVVNYLIDIIERDFGSATVNASVIEAFRTLRNHYLDEEHRSFQIKIAQSLISWVKRSPRTIKPWNQHKSPVELMLNKPFPICITLLINILAEIKEVDDGNQIISTCLLYLDNQLKKNETDWLLRCVLASQLNYLFYLDPLWSQNHLEVIFNRTDLNATIPVTICHVTSSMNFIKKWYPFFSDTGYYIPTLNMPNNSDAIFLSIAKRNISIIATYAFIHDLDNFELPDGLLNVVVHRMDANMLIVGISYFKELLANDLSDDDITKATIESKFTAYLTAVSESFREYEQMQIFSLVKCMQYIQNPSLELWNTLISFAGKCPEYSIYDGWFDLMQMHISSRTEEVADLLIALIQNPKFRHLQEEKRDVLRLLLQKLQEYGEKEKMRTIRNLLISKGLTEFADIS